MEKLEFSANEIAVLKKAAGEAQKAGEARAKEILKEGKLELTLSPELKALIAPEGGAVNGGGCYACVACIGMFMVLILVSSR
jgi:hypothetical protein